MFPRVPAIDDKFADSRYRFPLLFSRLFVQKHRRMSEKKILVKMFVILVALVGGERMMT